MMQYYKYPNPYITDEEVATDYLEVHGNVIMRQLVVFENSYESSNVELRLADAPFDYDEVKDYDLSVEPITKEEFDAAWQKHLQQHAARWNAAKKRFPINTSVTGCMAVFFPQGVIVELGQQIFGVTDYVQARATAKPDFIMGVGFQISGIVTGYDEANQWVELDSPQIHADKLCGNRLTFNVGS